MDLYTFVDRLSDIITDLENNTDISPSDVKVKIAYQPDWPLCNDIDSISMGPDRSQYASGDDYILYIAGMYGNEYAPKCAFDDTGIDYIFNRNSDDSDDGWY